MSFLRILVTLQKRSLCQEIDVQDMAPAAHTATASTSTLCKLLTWHMDGTWQQAAVAGAQPRLLHQADWLASLLHGNRCYSDWNNALKLGFDPEIEAYPSWLMEQVSVSCEMYITHADITSYFMWPTNLCTYVLSTLQQQWP